MNYIVARGEASRRLRLSTQTQPFDQRAVALDVDVGDVLEQPATTADQQQQTAPGVVVVLVLLEVLGEVGDALGQKRDLGFRRAGVGLVQAVGAQDFFLLLGGQRHENISINRYREEKGSQRGRRGLQHTRLSDFSSDNRGDRNRGVDNIQPIGCMLAG